MEDSFFKRLDAEQEESFRQWARDNFVKGDTPNPVWHPVVRDEWQKLEDA